MVGKYFWMAWKELNIFHTEPFPSSFCYSWVEPHPTTPFLHSLSLLSWKIPSHHQDDDVKLIPSPKSRKCSHCYFKCGRDKITTSTTTASSNFENCYPHPPTTHNEWMTLHKPLAAEKQGDIVRPEIYRNRALSILLLQSHNANVPICPLPQLPRLLALTQTKLRR